MGHLKATSANGEEMKTYEQFVAKYGKRPPDIVFAITQKDTEEDTLKKVGEWLDSINFDDYDIEGVKMSFQHYSVIALRSGRMPEEG